jgi:hypothetical protein
MRLDPPITSHAPPRVRGSRRRNPALRSRPWIAAFGLLVIAAGCGRVAPVTPAPETPAPGTPAPTTARSGGAPTTADVRLDGLVVAAGGPLLVTDLRGDLVAFDPPSGPVSAVTAAAGVIVAIDPAGLAAHLDRSAPAPTWLPLTLPPAPRATVRFAAIAPSGNELAIVAGDPQGTAFSVTVLDLARGASRAMRIERGLNGPPSWLGPDTIALDVIRDAGHSGIATIGVRSGSVTDRPGPGSVVVSSIDGSRLAIDDPASGDVLIGDVRSWETGSAGTMRRIPGPPAAGIEGLAMSSDGTRLAVVRRSDAGSSIEILVRVGDDWRSVRTVEPPGDDSLVAAWPE